MPQRAPPHAFKKGQSGNPKGRPKGAKSKLTLLTEKERQQLADREGILPLQFLVSILRDPEASLEHKLEAARIASPYLHRKMPIAIEGGDPGKPIVTLDAAMLRNLKSAEVKVLYELLAKLGMASEAAGT